MTRAAPAAVTSPPRDGRPLLELADLDVFLGESHILHGVTFDVPEGGVTALLGRNGVGKTTTLRGILGLVDRQGTVRFDGADISAEPTHRIIGRSIAYVPEDREVFSELTVAENLRLAERPGASPRYDLVHELFPRLAERANQSAGTLSGGEQQMLALGRALLNDNHLLLIDEPTKGLAPHLVTEVAVALDTVSQLATTLLVEQNLDVVRRIADQVVVLDQGVVVHAGPAETLLDDPDRTRDLLGVSGTSRRPGGRA